MTAILFIGDIVGEAGLAFLEQQLAALVAQHAIDIVIANAENLDLTSPHACGMKHASVERLFAAGVELITGGNHSWDGVDGHTIHADERILRPLNYGHHAPGRGAAILTKNGFRLGVVNLISRGALSEADHPADTLQAQLDAWQGQTDAILVDYHGTSVMEKIAFAFAFDGQVSAVVGTHTHVPTLDTRVLPKGTAYVSDVGMTGPGGGIQGYQPEKFVNLVRSRLPDAEPLLHATGEVELGAVVIRCEAGRPSTIERVYMK